MRDYGIQQRSFVDATLTRSAAVPGNHVRPTLVFAGVFALAFLVHATHPLGVSPEVAGPVVRTTAGTGLVVAGIALTAWCLSLFRWLRTGIMPDRSARRLVTTGPYRFSRNPMFVGFALVYAGLALVLDSVWPLLFFPLVVAIVNRTVIRHEEACLRRVFGGEFERYRARVRRWI